MNLCIYRTKNNESKYCKIKYYQHQQTLDDKYFNQRVGDIQNHLKCGPYKDPAKFTRR